jgi:SAM-dependent methyltransferase
MISTKVGSDWGDAVLSKAVPWLRGVGSHAGEPLAMSNFAEGDGQIVDGVLVPSGGKAWYPIISGVPCFLLRPLRPDLRAFAARFGLDEPAGQSEGQSRSGAIDQAKTRDSFSAKWRRIENWGFEPEHRKFHRGWYCKKLGLADETDLKAFYRDRQRVLEVGPGSGFNTRFIAENCTGEVFALDVSDAAHTTYQNTRDLPNCTVVQADLMDAPFEDAFFDLIVADGVLHHTPDTREAVRALYKKLQPGGQFFFYVYKKMGAARQFSDQYVRDTFKRLSPEDCYDACEAITELGRALSRLNAEITLEKPIPVLGIPAGTHNVQRLIYYNFLKCFWNEAFDFETNNMVNFDWYHPHNAWQHTVDEVSGWLDELGVRDYVFHDANPNGISVLLTKRT